MTGPGVMDQVFGVVGDRLAELSGRQRALTEQTLKQVGALVAIATVVLVVLAAIRAPLLAPIVVVATGAAILVLAWMWFTGRNRIRDEYKHVVVNTVLAQHYPGVRFIPEGGISPENFARSGLFPDPDTYKTEDGFGGTIGSTELTFGEVHTQDRRQSGKNSHMVTTFDGLFLVADFHKHFHGSTRVLPDKAQRLFGAAGELVQGFRPGMSEQLVNLENPDFERAFKTVSTDQVEARYILSPAMMERILSLHSRWGSELRLSFRGSLVFIAIDVRRNLFDPGLAVDVQNEHQIRRVVAEVLACCAIVDELDLNTRIWTKR